MLQPLQHWREDFERDPAAAFDRLVRGAVPLGAGSQLSFGEILDDLFAPGDEALDSAAAEWLESHLLGRIPAATSHDRWAFTLEEYFRGIASMELPRTGDILRRQHKRLRLWLGGFYEGADRDPYGAYLIALARAQNDQRFSPLWRRLILGEEFSERPYLGIGVIGFRKMPGEDGRASSDVPDGLLRAILELADKPGTGQARWKQMTRSLFATYRRSEGYWIDRLAPLLSPLGEDSNASTWLTALLPRIVEWRRDVAAGHDPSSGRPAQVPVPVSQEWARRVRQNPAVTETPEFSTFLEAHRTYANATGDPEYINKTFNNLSIALIRADAARAAFAVGLMEEALQWAPWNPHNWTSYAIVLSAAHRESDAIDALWEARYRIPWNPFIRNELGRILREAGDLIGSEGVLREAVGHFPSNPVSRGALAETLRAMGRLEDARSVLEHACREFPNHVICRSALADLLIDLDDVHAAERVYREALDLDARNPYARGGLARTLSILSARDRDVELRDEAKRILQELAREGNRYADSRLLVFDDQWVRATTDTSVKFRRETADRQTHGNRARPGRTIAEMSAPERLGRAMICLRQAEHTDDASQRASLCAYASDLLDMHDDDIHDDMLAAVIETRGLVGLASGDANAALAYFERQIHEYGRGGWIGIRLGAQRARMLLGEPWTADPLGSPPSSRSVRFALHVARVIQTLSASPQESDIRETLKTLYPRAAELAANTRRRDGEEVSIEGGEEMLGAFLQTRWFHPAGIYSAEDLDRPDALHAVVERIHDTRTDTFDVLSNSTLAAA